MSTSAAPAASTSTAPFPKVALGVILALSAVIVAFLFWLIYFAPGVTAPAGYEGGVARLPAVNALLNATSATFVVAGLLFIARQRIKAHIICMIGATVASAAFLVSYLIYHAIVGHTSFTATGLVRPVYFFILITHIVLSVVVVPLILTTLFMAITRRWPSHRKVAKWTFPVWLYVSVTGVAIFALNALFNTGA